MKNLFFLLFPCWCLAQTLSGSVVSQSGAPISSVRVYVDGSSIATLSDAEGKFSIDIGGVRNGNLVIKKADYEVVIFPFRSDESRKIKAILSRETEISEIRLLHFSAKLRNRYEARFLNEFLGVERAEISIKNLQDLLFAYDSEAGALHVKAKLPLVIENKNLGYTVEFTLLNFESKSREGLLAFSGTSFFSPMKGTKKTELQWKANRLNAYFGSSMHFMRSAFTNSLASEGFIVNRIVKIRNEKYPTEEELKKVEDFWKSMRGSLDKKISILVPSDISEISRRKSAEKPFLLALTERNVPEAKYIRREDGAAYLDFENILGIVYKKYTYYAEKERIEKTATPLTHSAMADPQGHRFQIFASGNFSDPDLLLFYDDWAKEKAGGLLPLDYNPEF